MNDLESAIMDAWLMAESTCQFINVGLDLESAEAPKPSNREALLVNFAVIQTTVMMEAVKTAFYGEEHDTLERDGRSEPAGVGEDAPHPRRGGSGRMARAEPRRPEGVHDMDILSPAKPSRVGTVRRPLRTPSFVQ